MNTIRFRAPWVSAPPPQKTYACKRRKTCGYEALSPFKRCPQCANKATHGTFGDEKQDDTVVSFFE